MYSGMFESLKTATYLQIATDPRLCIEIKQHNVSVSSQVQQGRYSKQTQNKSVSNVNLIIINISAVTEDGHLFLQLWLKSLEVEN